MNAKPVLIAFLGMFAASSFAQPSPMDRRFVKAASQGNRAEVLLGRVASQRGGSPNIRQFGQQMVLDHGKALSEVTRLAYDKRVTIPTYPKPEDQRLLLRLSRLRGTAFDRQYRQAMIEDHRMDIAEFSRESANGRDPAIRGWAKKTLPTLRMHLQMIQAARV